jgi:chaperonin GroEL
MSFKRITHKNEFSQKIKIGVNEISSIVARTLGPGGLPILLERQGVSHTGDPLTPLITKDGVTVASECSNPDPEIDLVIQTIKTICIKTNRVAGDGTTTAIVLGAAILKECLERLEKDSKLNPQIVKRSLEAASRNVLEQLKALAIPVKDPKMIEDVATISANGDAEIGSIIRQAFDAVGAEGVITVDEGYTPKTTLDIVEGFQIRRGAEAQDRFFNNSDRTKFEAENVRVLLFDGKLNSFNDILPALNAIAAENPTKIPPIAIVAHEFSPEVIQFLLIQKVEHSLNFCAVKAPHTTTVRTSMLDDMAVMLDGYRFGNGNRDMSSAKSEQIGGCEKVVIDKYTATFYGGFGDESDVIARVEQLKAARKTAESPYDAALISDRIAALSQGIAKIGVGGSTDLEVKELYHRIEDALNAARAAVEEGIIPGGGVVLARIANKFASSEQIGEQILANALIAPLLQIIQNIGEDAHEILFSLPHQLENMTYDAVNKQWVNALEMGIIDPVKVTRTALENAVSIASLLSTSGGGIVFNRPQ